DLLRVHMLDRKRVQASVLDHVDARPVRDARYGEFREGGEGAAVVERGCQRSAGVDEEALCFLRALLVVDVDVRAEPFDDRAALVRHRNRTRQVPAVRAVGRAAEAQLVLVRLPRRERGLPAVEHPAEILRMYDLRPALLDELGERGRDVVEAALVDVVELAARQRGPDLLGLDLGKEAVPLLALAPQLRELLLFELLGLPPQLLVLLVQLDEDGDLRAEDVGVERLEDVVDRAGGGAAEDLLLVLRDRGEEDDGNVPRALALLDEPRGLEAVELRHLDVEQDHRHVVAEELPQRVLAGARIQKRLAERLENSLEREEILGA